MSKHKEQNIVIIGCGTLETVKIVTNALNQLKEQGHPITHMPIDEPYVGHMAAEAAIAHILRPHPIAVLTMNDTPRHIEIEEVILELKIPTRHLSEEISAEKNVILERLSANPLDRQTRSRKSKKYNKYRR